MSLDPLLDLVCFWHIICEYEGDNGDGEPTGSKAWI